MAPKARVDPLSVVVLRVVPKFNDVELSAASAFVVRFSNADYLITNWHVVTGRDAETNKCLDRESAAIPNSLTVRLHKRASLGQWTEINVALVDPEGNPTWFAHPQGRLVDVVAIPLARSDLSGADVYPMDYSLSSTNMVASPAMVVHIIGYPHGLSVGGGLPIWKTGHIASDPDVDFFPGCPAFLIDATTRQGMSGSPVIIRSDSYVESSGLRAVSGRDVRTRLLGVYAGRIHKDSEIGRVWRGFVIREIIERRLIFDGETKRTAPARLADCPCGSGRRFRVCCGAL